MEINQERLLYKILERKGVLADFPAQVFRQTGWMRTFEEQLDSFPERRSTEDRILISQRMPTLGGPNCIGTAMYLTGIIPQDIYIPIPNCSNAYNDQKPYPRFTDYISYLREVDTLTDQTLIYWDSFAGLRSHSVAYLRMGGEEFYLHRQGFEGDLKEFPIRKGDFDNARFFQRDELKDLSHLFEKSLRHAKFTFEKAKEIMGLSKNVPRKIRTHKPALLKVS